jgi:hypothetical protein
MTVIMKYISGQTAFEPEVTAAMGLAFDDACNSLRINGDQRGRQVIATRIIDLASAGITDARALRDRILQEARTDG